MIYDIIIPTLKQASAIADITLQMVATAGVPVKVFVTSLDKSASINRNYGLANTTSNPVFMIDDDIINFPSNWAKDMLEVMEQYPNCMACSPRLMKSNGNYGPMVGVHESVRRTGIEVLKLRQICTACLCLRRTPILFDELYVGSGFEDNDYCNQIVQAFPNAEFICLHDLKVTHLNEMKNQHGHYWTLNKARYTSKWNKPNK